MQKTYFAMITLLLSLFSLQTEAVAETYKIVVDDWVPYSYVDDGKPMGTDIDLLNEVGKKTGITFDFVFVPWLRAMSMVKNGEADGIISLYDVPERRSFLRYVSSPISYETVVLISSVNKTLKPIHSINDLAGLSIGVTPDTSNGAEFDRFTGYKKEICMNSDIKISMLIGNRMDAAVINQAVFRARAKLDPTLKDKIHELPFIVNRQELHLAFSLKADKLKHFPVDKISKAINSLRKNGTVAKINEKYFGK